ncbi:hypothetical protein [Neisseria sicca]|uniref:hypothetical protein n=1 Tax=Neisseria sicca TaxID=490 RepID=UPI0011BCF80D|nr:hypothetical protein [Neisseria sicca]
MWCFVFSDDVFEWFIKRRLKIKVQLCILMAMQFKQQLSVAVSDDPCALPIHAHCPAAEQVFQFVE